MPIEPPPLPIFAALVALTTLFISSILIQWHREHVGGRIWRELLLSGPKTEDEIRYALDALGVRSPLHTMYYVDNLLARGLVQATRRRDDLVVFSACSATDYE